MLMLFNYSRTTVAYNCPALSFLLPYKLALLVALCHHVIRGSLVIPLRVMFHTQLT